MICRGKVISEADLQKLVSELGGPVVLLTQGNEPEGEYSMPDLARTRPETLARYGLKAA